MFEEQYRRDNQRLHADRKQLERIKRLAVEEERNRDGRGLWQRYGAAAAAFALVAGGILSMTLRNASIGAPTESSGAGVMAAQESVMADSAEGTAVAAEDYETLYQLISTMEINGAVLTAESTADTAEASAADVPAGEAGAGDGDRSTDGSHSQTNVQVQGVDEADVVKTDGEYIYYLTEDQLIILSARGGETAVVSQTDFLPDGSWGWGSEMFVSGDRLMIICGGSATVWAGDARDIRQDETFSVVFDIHDRAHPQKTLTLGQSGSYVSSRMAGEYVYLVTTQYIWQYARETPASYIPSVSAEGTQRTLPADSISILDHPDSPVYTVVSAFHLPEGTEQSSAKASFGSAGDVYCSGNSLLIAFPDDVQQVSPIAPDENGRNVQITKSSSRTRLILYGLRDGTVTRLASSSVKGSLVNQFAMDEYQGVFRLVTTVDQWEERIYTDGLDAYEYSDTSMNCLYTLDGELKLLGSIENLARNEWVKSVRFDGEIAYFVTFRQVDPLFTVDLSDPAKPKLLNALKIPGFSEYLHVYGEDRLLGLGYLADEETGATKGVKLTMFDTSDKTNVLERHTLAADADWTSAAENHKAILVSPEKGLVAFPADSSYQIYRYDDQTGFTLLANVTLDGGMWQGNLRGLFIGDYFYVLGGRSAAVMRLVDFGRVTTVEF